MSSIRLDKFLSSQLACSRADAKKLLRQKRVAVNGVPAQRAEQPVDPAADTVTVDGALVEYKQYLYIMQHKPLGVVSASAGRGDVTVIDLLPPELRRPGLFPAGRLDKDTTGFVFITDDGQFAHDILSPARHVEKTYVVTLHREVTPEEQAAITNGMRLGEEQLKPARLRRLDTPAPQYEIVLTEGRYHQIRRMFGSTGNPVTALMRTKIGALPLDPGLLPGRSRELTSTELELLAFRQNTE